MNWGRVLPKRLPSTKLLWRHIKFLPRFIPPFSLPSSLYLFPMQLILLGIIYHITSCILGINKFLSIMSLLFYVLGIAYSNRIKSVVSKRLHWSAFLVRYFAWTAFIISKSFLQTKFFIIKSYLAIEFIITRCFFFIIRSFLFITFTNLGSFVWPSLSFIRKMGFKILIIYITLESNSGQR